MLPVTEIRPPTIIQHLVLPIYHSLPVVISCYFFLLNSPNDQTPNYCVRIFFFKKAKKSTGIPICLVTRSIYS